MADMPCIYDMSLISEDDDVKHDILNGKVVEILISLLSGSKTVKELSKELNVPSFSIQLYLTRLIGSNLVKVANVKVYDGKIEKSYELASSNVEILNYLKGKGSNNEDLDIELSAQHFANLTRKAVKDVSKSQEKPHKIKAYFIKADEETMTKFKKELEALFDRFQSLENLSADETYAFISVLSPYK